jgi:hypothetical protein
MGVLWMLQVCDMARRETITGADKTHCGVRRTRWYGSHVGLGCDRACL